MEFLDDQTSSALRSQVGTGHEVIIQTIQGDAERSIFQIFSPSLPHGLAEIVLRMSHDNEVGACSSIVLRINERGNLAEMKVDHPNKRAVVMDHKF